MSLPPPSPRQSRLIWLAITGLALATLVGLAVTLVWGMGHVVNALAPVLWPLAIAAIIACLLDPAYLCGLMLCQQQIQSHANQE